MKYLADTHVLIWARQEPEKLSRAAREVLEDGDANVLFSVASIWEVAVKVGLELRLDGSIEEFAQAHLRDAMELLPIRIAHAARVAELALHHRDPFDRLLIAQALEEDLQLITADPAFERYPIGTLW